LRLAPAMGNVVLPMWAECPALTRLVVVGYPAMGLCFAILGGFGLSVDFAFTCSLYAVAGKFWIWTLALSGFYHHFMGGISFLMLLLEMYMAMQHMPRRERELGSTAFLLWLLLLNAAINAVYLVLMVALSSTWNAWYYYSSNTGLWPPIVAMMSMQLLADPGGSTSFWGLVAIPNKWYPLFFIGMFSLFNGMMLWDMVAATAVAYAGFLRPGADLDRLLPSQAKLHALECRMCGSDTKVFLGAAWIGACSAAGSSASSSGGWSSAGGGDGNRPAGQVLGLQMPSRTSGGSGKFTVFSGQGNVLGTNSPRGGAPAPSPPAAPAAAVCEGAPGAFQDVSAVDEETGESSKLIPPHEAFPGI